MLLQAVILAGGRGERLGALTYHRPKPMIEVHGRPFLEYLIEQLRENGIKRVLLLTGYLGEQLKEHFGSGEKFDVEISYSQGPVEWETGRRLLEAEQQLEDKFFLLYSDNFLCYRLADLLSFHRDSGRALSMVVVGKPNGNVRLADDGGIEVYSPERRADLDWVDLGFMIASKQGLLSQLSGRGNVSLPIILEQLATQGQLSGYRVYHRYYSIGDEERLQTMAQYLTPKKILLIDRDGTINRCPPRGCYVTEPSKLELLPQAVAGMQLLSQAGYQFIVLTNQAGVATGAMSASRLEDIHERLQQDLFAKGVTILRIYSCTDHWQDTTSFRRKPQPGMFFEASDDYLLRLDRTWYLGDDPRDVVAARRALVKSLFVGSRDVLTGLEPGCQPDGVAPNLVEAASIILART